jgi:hypothetical protein
MRKKNEKKKCEKRCEKEMRKKMRKKKNAKKCEKNAKKYVVNETAREANEKYFKSNKWEKYLVNEVEEFEEAVGHIGMHIFAVH